MTDDRTLPMTAQSILAILEEELYLGRHHPTDYHPAIIGAKEAAARIAALISPPVAALDAAIECIRQTMTGRTSKLQAAISRIEEAKAALNPEK
jgi:hypothetical protein